MSTTMEYDLVILGGGAAAFAALPEVIMAAADDVSRPS